MSAEDITKGQEHVEQVAVSSSQEFAWPDTGMYQHHLVWAAHSSRLYVLLSMQVQQSRPSA